MESKHPADVEDLNPANKKPRYDDDEIKLIIEEVVKSSKEAPKAPELPSKIKIGPHSGVIINIDNEDGLPCALVKHSPLSDIEKYVFELIINHPDDVENKALQTRVVRILETSAPLDEDKSKELYNDLLKEETFLGMGLDEEEVVKAGFELMIGCTQWVRVNNNNIINGFSCMPGYISLKLTEWY